MDLHTRSKIIVCLNEELKSCGTDPTPFEKLKPRVINEELSLSLNPKKTKNTFIVRTKHSLIGTYNKHNIQFWWWFI